MALSIFREKKKDFSVLNKEYQEGLMVFRGSIGIPLLVRLTPEPLELWRFSLDPLSFTKLLEQDLDTPALSPRVLKLSPLPHKIMRKEF